MLQPGLLPSYPGGGDEVLDRALDQKLHVFDRQLYTMEAPAEARTDHPPSPRAHADSWTEHKSDSSPASRRSSRAEAGAIARHSIDARIQPDHTDKGPNGTSTIANGHAVTPGHATPTATAHGAAERTSLDSEAHLSQGMLGIFHHSQPHRKSSPARYSHGGTAQTVKPAPPPLQQRHTLEVPRLSMSRQSRDLHSSHGYGGRPSEDGSVANGGLISPSSPRMRRASTTLVRRGTRSLTSDQQLNEIPQDEDATRWAENIRQKRATRRRRREEEDEDRVIVGTKVDQHHVNYVTAYNMLTGIRFTVSRTNAKIRTEELTDAHFAAAHKFSFDVTGNELTPSAKYDFKFKDYAPEVFRDLRSIFRLDPADYLVSLTSKYILSELGSPGKSGSFFYFSRDYKYIIKTIHHAEHVLLRKILRQYYAHVKQYPDTLVSQFYGLHRVKLPYGRKIHFVVMNNLFPPHRDIHHTFDLKGSTIGRELVVDKLEDHPRATLKDLNWRRSNMHLELGPKKRREFIQQVERDVDLLKKLKIMDYSLLIGIHDLAKGNEENLRDRTLQIFQPHGFDPDAEGPHPPLMRTPSKLETTRKAKELRQNLKTQKPVPMGSGTSKMPDELPEHARDKGRNFVFYADDGGFRATHGDDDAGAEIYYLGIIDCLTKYGLTKRVEHFVKSFLSPEAEISAIPPERYGTRFVNFIASNTDARGTSLTAGPYTAPVEEKGSTDRERTTTDVDGQVLPVVEEAAENASVGGRSGRSGRSGQSNTGRSHSNLQSPTPGRLAPPDPSPVPAEAPADGEQIDERADAPPAKPELAAYSEKALPPAPALDTEKALPLPPATDSQAEKQG